MNSQEIYQLISSIKNPSTTEDDYKITITNDEDKVIGFFVPITNKLINDNENVVFLLTKWRKMFKKFFLTQFNPSPERTKKWLKQIVLPSPDRVLFLICTEDAKPIGNFGICNITQDSFELDNLIRGEKGGDPQLIYHSEISLLKWAFVNFDSSRSVLHVFSNNSKTIALHERVGFEVIGNFFLEQNTSDDSISYSITTQNTQTVDFTYLEMSMSREKFFANFEI